MILGHFISSREMSPQFHRPTTYPCTIWAHLGTIPCLSLCFSFEILKEKNIVTKQMKNEYFQENKEKSIEYTREMILSDDQNEIIES